MHPDKLKNVAQNLITRQIALGLRQPAKFGSCEACGVNREISPSCRLHWHHPNYREPSIVMCVCTRCHMKIHGEMRRKARLDAATIKPATIRTEAPGTDREKVTA